MRVRALAWVSVVIAAACGGSSDTRPNAAAYAALAQNISSTASSYGTAAATTDAATCQSGHTAYDHQVRPMIEQMQGTSGDMDREMSMMGRTGDADMTCGANAMMAELDAHAAAACTSTSMTDNHTEAMRHATAMETWATHQHQRAEEMGGMMGTSGMGMGGTTTTMTCQHNGDGTYTLGP